MGSTVLIARILLALLFIVSGVMKLGGYEATQEYMLGYNIPGWLLPLVILVEIGGGGLLVIGWFTRMAAVVLAVFTVLSAIIFHTDFAGGDPTQLYMFLKNLAITGGLLVLAAHGADSLSLDRGRR